MNFSLF